MNESDVIDAEQTTALPADDDGRHLSIFRVALVIVVVLACIGGGTWWFMSTVRANEDAAAVAAQKSWFAPYVDVTSTPTYAFEEMTGKNHSSAILSFIVSAQDHPCEPSWGMAYSMSAAAANLDLDRRVARLRQLGGEVTVSFGGAANSELAIGCTDPVELTAAYTSVIDRYELTAIDLDIEGQLSMAPEVNARRATAIAALVQQQTAAGKPLGVWLTLPVSGTGLTPEGLEVLTSMLSAGVRPAGVNAMTMDYGVPLPAGTSMADQGELALTALSQQIITAYATLGTDLSTAAAWRMIGSTPMIGQNDVPAEIFGLADADQMLAFATQQQLGRLSMWSANRDQACGPNYPNVKVVSDVCSGIEQAPGQFGNIFAQFGAGQDPQTTSAAASPTAGSETAAPSPTAAATAIEDDPATSPYPIWNENQSYPKGSKVVWHRNVYQAKWYSVGDQPDLPVATADQTPWTLIGPVLPGDTPAPTPTLPAGTYPDWSPTQVYVAGSRVLYNSIGYEAKYWTQGEVPGSIPTTQGQPSAWQVINSP
jgi:chitinase